MSQHKPNLIEGYDFSSFTGTLPDGWTSVNLANATRSQIQKGDPLDSPAREVFARAGHQANDYTWQDGPGSLRVEMNSSAVANGFRLRSRNAPGGGAGHLVTVGKLYQCLVVGRSSVVGNLGRVQITAMDSTPAVAWYLQVKGGAAYNKMNPEFEWSASSAEIDFYMVDWWAPYGFTLPEIPVGVESVAVELANGSAGAHTLDFGEVRLEPVLYEGSGA